ncbi:uncharacterized protein CcaverHIS019_0511200 [Cutaneotrichosporon cavernicola]|uniref:Uncharacterized protein n=1 Tax=Cutaneotrichosporon cavernicola TaxID=279322 RepID=A0AA48L7P7_9TREE|nr:uncharacterized protein CcaverHIS019_0511200 [Cutaneotrichosporon cavernicola]BEI93492.1 hypothetical protein CcaverHIS019_0511200 [Cutaneotrichosporon cavernicola]
MKAWGQEKKAKTSRYRQYQKAYISDSDSCYALAVGDAYQSRTKHPNVTEHKDQKHNDLLVAAAQMLSTSSVPTAVTAEKRIKVLVGMGDATMETYASQSGKERRVEVYQTFVDYLVDVEAPSQR